jgi:hypothetical protein
MEQYDKAYIVELLQGLYADLLLIGLGLDKPDPDNILVLLKVIDKVKARVLTVGHSKHGKGLENV